MKTVLNAGSAIIVTLLSLLFAFLQWRAARYHRSQLGIVYQSTSIISGSGGVPKDLGMTFRGRAVTDPHLVELAISNAERRDIVRGQFDGEEPLALLLAAPILEIVEVSGPHGYVLPEVKQEAGKILIGPSLLPGRSRFVVRVLTESAAQTPECVSPIADCDIKLEEYESVAQRIADETRFFSPLTRKFLWVTLGLFVVYAVVISPSEVIAIPRNALVHLAQGWVSLGAFFKALMSGPS